MFAFLAIVAVAVFAFSYIYGKDYDIEDFPSLWENPNESNNQFLIGILIFTIAFSNRHSKKLFAVKTYFELLFLFFFL